MDKVLRTAKKRLKNPNFTPDIGKGTQFSSVAQPTPENKSKGWELAKEEKKKKLILREMIEEVFAMQYKFKQGSAIQEQLQAAFGDIEGKSAGEISLLQAANRSILSKYGTQDLEKLLNQAYGLPKQSTEITGKAGEAIQIILQPSPQCEPLKDE